MIVYEVALVGRRSLAVEKELYPWSKFRIKATELRIIVIVKLINNRVFDPHGWLFISNNYLCDSCEKI